MPVSNEAVLWYCPDPVVSAAAKKVFLTMGIKIKPVEAARTGQTVGCLFGVKGFDEDPAAAPGPAPAQSALVLSGFSNARLDGLLTALRKAGVPKIAWKAVLTPTNVGWTFRDLCGELAREHEAMSLSQNRPTGGK